MKQWLEDVSRLMLPVLWGLLALLCVFLLSAWAASCANACPSRLADDGTALLAGCPAPVDSVCYSLLDGITVAGLLARGGECEAQLKASAETERALSHEAITGLLQDLRRCSIGARTGALALRTCEVDLTAVLEAQASASRQHVLPGWAWVLSGILVPAASYGGCALAGCETAARWGAAAGGAGLAVGAALLVEW
mgnify:CR=1 FL=1